MALGFRASTLARHRLLTGLACKLLYLSAGNRIGFVPRLENHETAGDCGDLDCSQARRSNWFFVWAAFCFVLLPEETRSLVRVLDRKALYGTLRPLHLTARTLRIVSTLAGPTSSSAPLSPGVGPWQTELRRGRMSRHSPLDKHEGSRCPSNLNEASLASRTELRSRLEGILVQPFQLVRHAHKH